ncbi:hypothetical protein ABH14_22575 [Brevibacillus brevis]|nr:hypothetical protein [Brevibacillus brevis]
MHYVWTSTYICLKMVLKGRCRYLDEYQMSVIEFILYCILYVGKMIVSTVPEWLWALAGAAFVVWFFQPRLLRR